MSLMSISVFAEPTRIPYFTLNIVGMGPANVGSPHQTQFNSANGNEKWTIYGNATGNENAVDLIHQNIPIKGSFFFYVCDTTKQPACVNNMPIARFDYSAKDPIALGFTSLNVVNLQPSTPGKPQVSWDNATHTITVNGNGW
jgi:hypothetical protein